MKSAGAEWKAPVRAFKTTRRRLPDWQQAGSIYFITFRTAELVLPPVARNIVLEACKWNHGKLIDLHAVVVMPDHVHLLLQPLPVRQEVQENGVTAEGVYSLGRIVHSLKSYSAHRINQALVRTGEVWQSERFDRIVRDEQEYGEKLGYILSNPAKNGLAEDPYAYPWVAFLDAPE